MYYYMLKKFHYFFVKDYESIYDGKIKMTKYQTYCHKSEILSYLLSIDDDLTKAYRLKERYREFNLTADYENCSDELDDIIDELDRKSTRLNSSHVRISYAVFCLKKKKKK